MTGFSLELVNVGGILNCDCLLEGKKIEGDIGRPKATII